MGLRNLAHILHVIDGLGLGGAERMLIDIANRTVADGTKVSVCITGSELACASQLHPSIDVIVLARTRRIDPLPMLRLARYLRTRDVDLIHAHMRSSAAFVILMRALRLVPVPVVFHDHFGTIETDRSVPRWFQLGHRFIGEYVGVHERLCEWARAAGMPAARTHMIPNGIDLDRIAASAAAKDLRGELGVAADTPLGLAVSTIRRDKGIEVLVRAIAQLDRPVHVAVAGGFLERDYLEEIRALISETKQGSRVTLLGPRDDVPALLRSVDVGLLASHTESGPLVLLEYLAAGLPIVATRVGDIGRRFAAANVPGFVEPGDPVAFARALDTVLALSPADRHVRGERGRLALTEISDIRAVMPRWYQLYETAVTA